ncbi:MAG: sigma-70 family RNA polymerase sigma factor [Gammaproteobacteria bacterium]|nr:sigma-70 family RNA polymerase sigma factor [Gammaproteobacteria bacterium]
MPEKIHNNTEAADIAVRIYAGDQTAEKALLDKYFQPMLALLRFRCHDPAVADDLCQETFRILIEQLRSKPMDNPEALGGYVRQIAMNLFINELRRSDRQRTSPDLESIDRQSAEQLTAYDLIQQEQSKIAVEAMLATLKTPRDRQVLRLFYLAELDKQEICIRLDLKPAHFDRVLHRAKQRIREQLQKNQAAGERKP